MTVPSRSLEGVQEALYQFGIRNLTKRDWMQVLANVSASMYNTSHDDWISSEDQYARALYWLAMALGQGPVGWLLVRDQHRENASCIIPIMTHQVSLGYSQTTCDIVLGQRLEHPRSYSQETLVMDPWRLPEDPLQFLELLGQMENIVMGLDSSAISNEKMDMVCDMDARERAEYESQCRNDTTWENPKNIQIQFSGEFYGPVAKIQVPQDWYAESNGTCPVVQDTSDRLAFNLYHGESLAIDSHILTVLRLPPRHVCLRALWLPPQRNRKSTGLLRPSSPWIYRPVPVEYKEPLMNEIMLAVLSEALRLDHDRSKVKWHSRFPKWSPTSSEEIYQSFTQIPHQIRFKFQMLNNSRKKLGSSAKKLVQWIPNKMKFRK
jgi:hypothetical protein